MRMLKAAGVIVGEIDGPRVCYALAPEALEPLAGLIAGVAPPQARHCCLPDAVLVA
jgi:ArsR family transcriptional regulator